MGFCIQGKFDAHSAPMLGARTVNLLPQEACAIAIRIKRENEKKDIYTYRILISITDE